MSAPHATAPTAHPRWGRTLAVAVVALAAVGALGYVWLASSPTPAYARGPGAYELRMTDYRFGPGELTWRAGERVRLTLVNDSGARPPAPHEFMLGRTLALEETVFGPMPGDGFRTDFFRGIRVRLSGLRGVSMVMTGTARVSGAGAVSGGGTQGSGSMPGMKMGGGSGSTGSGSMPGMKMGAGSGSTGSGSMPGMKMGAGSGSTGSGSMPGMAGGALGFMLVVDGGGRATLSFTVPNRPGRWQFACFQQSKQHYLNGMTGWVTIVPAARA